MDVDIKPGEITALLIVKVPKQLRDRIKKSAIDRNIKMKQWIIAALLKEILLEDSYNQ
jgi:hypothetical protein